MTYLNNTYSINCFNIDKKLLHFFAFGVILELVLSKNILIIYT